MGFSIKGNNVLVKIEVVCRPYSNAKNIWDLNWLTCDISIKIPGYTADFNTYLTCSELQSFYNELRQMHETLNGKASLSPLESEIFIEAEINKLGKVNWKVNTEYPVGTGNSLTFEFETDQSYIYETLQDLKSTINVYPIISV